MILPVNLASASTAVKHAILTLLLPGFAEPKQTLGVKTTTATLSLASGNVITATLTHSQHCVFTMPAHPAAGTSQSFILMLKQAATVGGGSATFVPAATGKVAWLGADPTITVTAGKMDILTFTSDGTNWYGHIAQGYTP